MSRIARTAAPGSFAALRRALGTSAGRRSPPHSKAGYEHTFDNRYLWMNLKRIIGSHFANYREAWEANRLVAAGKVHPALSKVYPLAETGQAMLDVHSDAHQGKVGVLCLAPHKGLGVSDHPHRGRHEGQINRFWQA